MNSLIRNATLSVSRRLQSYEALEQSDQNRVLRLGEGGGGGGHGGRTWSRRRKDQSTSSQMMPSFSYRRERAKKRLIFLRSYQLSAVESPTTATTRSGCWGLKKVLLKTKAALMRPIKSARLDPLRWCGSGGGGKVPAMCATSIRAVA